MITSRCRLLQIGYDSFPTLSVFFYFYMQSSCIALPDSVICCILWQFGIKIFVVTSFKDTCYIEILPQTEQKSNRSKLCFKHFVSFRFVSSLLNSSKMINDACSISSVSNAAIFLSFWAEVHYNSIYPLGGKDLLNA